MHSCLAPRKSISMNSPGSSNQKLNVQPGSANLYFLTEMNVDQVLQALQDAGIEVRASSILLRLCAESLDVGPRGL